jgi:hypothetical protein
MDYVNATRSFLDDESTWPAVHVELNDIQGLWGGRRISVAGTRHVVVQLVQPGLLERRYEFELNPAVWMQLLEVLIEKDFATIQPAERLGIPDEARPRITVVNAAKDQRSVAQWAGVKDERFDAVYQALRQLERLTDRLEPVYEGPYTVAG